MTRGTVVAAVPGGPRSGRKARADVASFVIRSASVVALCQGLPNHAHTESRGNRDLNSRLH